MTEQPVTKKAELLADLERSWQALNATLGRLSKTQMTALRDAQGWSVKDHIVHLVLWERSAIFLLQGKARHLALGVEEALFATATDDEINAVVQRRERDRPLEQALAELRETHQQLVALLQGLTDTDLLQPYRHYLSERRIKGEGPPAIDVVRGNSAGHYAEHLPWIQALVESGH